MYAVRGFGVRSYLWRVAHFLLTTKPRFLNIHWWGCAVAHPKRGVLGTATTQNGGLRHGHNQKKKGGGGLRHGNELKKGGPKNWSCKKENLSN